MITLPDFFEHGDDLLIRSMVPNDIPYVVKSWLMTHRDSQSAAPIEQELFHALCRPIVESLVENESLIRAVAVPAEDEDMIAGFVVADVIGPVLHYLHVRGSFRGLGVARAMLDHVGICKEIAFAATFDTRDLRRAMGNGWKIVLKPELLEDAGRKR